MRGIINSKNVEKAEVQEQRGGIVSLMFDSLRERGEKNENMERYTVILTTIARTFISYPDL